MYATLQYFILDIVINSHKVIVYRIAEKFGGSTDQPASRQIKILHCILRRNWWVWSFTNSVSGITRSNHFYHIPILQGLFSISLLVQDNLSPIVGVQILWLLRTQHSIQFARSNWTDLASHSLNNFKHACACGRFGAWLDRTRPSTNIFVRQI